MGIFKTKIRNVFFIIGLSTCFGFLKNIFLARELSKMEMGTFTLAMTIVGFVYPITMFGQQKSFVRFFSQHDPSKYNWRSTTNKILFFGFLLSLSAVLIFYQIYNFGIEVIIFTLAAILSSAIGELFTNLIRCQGKYELSIFLQRIIRFLLPIILIFLYFFNNFQLNSIFFAFGITYLTLSLLIIHVTYKSIQVGNQALPKMAHIDGMFFIGLDISILVITLVANFFIAKMISLEALAVYFAISSVMRIYELALGSVEYVLMPHSNRLDKNGLMRIILQIIGIASLISLFYVLLGGKLVNLLFKGKYEQGIELIPLFIAIGFISMLEIVPTSVITGRLKQEALKYFLYFNIVLMLLSLIFNIWFIFLWQLPGALISILLIRILRMGIGYTILFKYYDEQAFGGKALIEYRI